jgi:O-antigen/teichoic acid export membrane protein
LKDRRNGWPILLVSSFFSLNDYINTLLIKHNLIQPLTEFVGSFNQLITFLGTFIVLLVLLTFTIMPNKKRGTNLNKMP